MEQLHHKVRQLQVLQAPHLLHRHLWASIPTVRQSHRNLSNRVRNLPWAGNSLAHCRHHRPGMRQGSVLALRLPLCHHRFRLQNQRRSSGDSSSSSSSRRLLPLSSRLWAILRFIPHLWVELCRHGDVEPQRGAVEQGWVGPSVTRSPNLLR